ncbi:MAG: hypothetical protein FWG98_11650 [Candidatus Cloacimonetes bacterium]|nr:hypothetical protein [Candidatus Cloacimonadota bacterium]
MGWVDKVYLARIDEVTRRLLREDSKKEPRNDGLDVVTRRLLRKDRKKGPRNDGAGW